MLGIVFVVAVVARSRSVRVIGSEFSSFDLVGLGIQNRRQSLGRARQRRHLGKGIEQKTFGRLLFHYCDVRMIVCTVCRYGSGVLVPRNREMRNHPQRCFWLLVMLLWRDGDVP